MVDKNCPFPGCNAGIMLEDIKKASAEYRDEIKNQLGRLTSSVDALVVLMRERARADGVIEQSIIFLREAEQKNEAAHKILFDQLRHIDSVLTGIRDESQRENAAIRKELDYEIDKLRAEHMVDMKDVLTKKDIKFWIWAISAILTAATVAANLLGRLIWN